MVIKGKGYNIEGFLCFKLDQKTDVINGYQKIRSRSWYCEKEGEFALEGEIWHQKM